MPYLTLEQLPPPPKDKRGWPWTEESPLLPDLMPDGNTWPKISIITPTYNQDEFFEETIRSVLLQGYPNLEYIIIDGESTDNTIEIIKKYSQFLPYWVSEPDNGQSHAVNKGIEKSTGQIIGWINSDDVYYPGAFRRIIETMWVHGAPIHPIIYGGIDLIDERGHYLQRFPGKLVDKRKLIAYWRQEWHIPQPTVFFRSDILKKHLLNESLHYAMDWELYLRLSYSYPFHHLPYTLVKFRSHSKSKTSGGWEPFNREQITISKKYWSKNPNSYMFYCCDYYLWPLTKKGKLVLAFLRNILKLTLGHKYYEKIKVLKGTLLARHSYK
ncbi:MAG: glycosyltransferase family 2 protein [bacterium]